MVLLFFLDEISGIVLKFLTNGSFSSGRMTEPPFLVFKDVLESKAFEHHVSQRLYEIIKLTPTTFGKIAKREKDLFNDTKSVDPIFMNQIKQYYALPV